MKSLRPLWVALALLTAAAVFYSWVQAWTTDYSAWHIVGLGLSVVFLALVWLYPGVRQPTKPPR
jgi:hypothetical protein